MTKSADGTTQDMCGFTNEGRPLVARLFGLRLEAVYPWIQVVIF